MGLYGKVPDRPQCSAVYGGLWADPAAPIRCERVEHPVSQESLDPFHRADRPGARICSVSWL